MRTLCLAGLFIFVSSLTINSEPSFNGSTPGCAGGGCHTIKSGIVQAEFIGNNQIRVTVTGTTSRIGVELVDESNKVVAFINSTNQNPYVLTAPSSGLYIVNAGFKNPSRTWGTFANIPVPVELSSFQAIFREKSVVLNWQTASETNNYGFDVEKSLNEQSEWTKLGFVAGHGTTVQSNEYTFLDTMIEKPGTHYYRIKQIDTNGDFEYSEIVSITIEKTLSFVLNQNYPNPFNSQTTIQYNLPCEGHVNISIYNLKGQHIRTLIDEQRIAGFHQASWDGMNSSGIQVPSGIYLAKFKSGTFENSIRMLLLQ